MAHLKLSNKLAKIAVSIHEEHKGYIERLKTASSELERPDFIWHYLLQSFATMGKSSGWKGLIGNKNNYNKVAYEALNQLTIKKREIVVKNTCHDAKVRMPDKKAGYILGCFDHVKDLGGLLETKEKLLNSPGRDGKIKFLTKFPGIGKKYARNIMMDVYHEEFFDSIAVDVRIKAISETLGIAFESYEKEEQFYLKSAKKARLSGWEMDRILYNFKDDFERKILEF